MKARTTESQFMELASALTNQMADAGVFSGLNFEIDPKVRSIRFSTNNGVVMYYPASNIWQYKQMTFESNTADFIGWMKEFYGNDRIKRDHLRVGPTRRERERKRHGTL